jgi:hypothetical protein
MKAGISIIERAFELAGSGTVESLEHIISMLHREGYVTRDLFGPKLRKQLRQAVKAARGDLLEPSHGQPRSTKWNINRGKQQRLPGEAQEGAPVTQRALTPLQLCEARKLLCLGRQRFGAQLGISEMTIALFEKDGRVFGVFDPRKARKILEAAGIEFFAESSNGPGVRLKNPLL